MIVSFHCWWHYLNILRIKHEKKSIQKNCNASKLTVERFYKTFRKIKLEDKRIHGEQNITGNYNEKQHSKLLISTRVSVHISINKFLSVCNIYFCKTCWVINKCCSFA